MFSQNDNPEIINININDSTVVGIAENDNNDALIFLRNATILTTNMKGEVTSKQQIDSGEIISFNEYEDQIWLTTTNKEIIVLDNYLNIINKYLLDQNALSVAPLENRKGIIISYHNYNENKAWFEYRSLPDFKCEASGFYGPDGEVVSSVSFYFKKELYFSCCSQHDFCLLKVENGEINLIEKFSGANDKEMGEDLTFSKLLYYSKKFLIDNMTVVIKTDIDIDRYIKRIIFFRNNSATHGAIDQRDQWIAFLNPKQLKLVNYFQNIERSFKTNIEKPEYIRLLKNYLVCSNGHLVSIWDFRSNAIKFIMD